MSIPKMAKAMGYIDDDLVSGAVEYKRTKKKNSWLKWGAMAACLCLVVGLAIPMLNNDNSEPMGFETVVEIKQATHKAGYLNSADIYLPSVVRIEEPQLEKQFATELETYTVVSETVFSHDDVVIFAENAKAAGWIGDYAVETMGNEFVIVNKAVSSSQKAENTGGIYIAAAFMQDSGINKWLAKNEINMIQSPWMTDTYHMTVDGNIFEDHISFSITDNGVVERCTLNMKKYATTNTVLSILDVKTAMANSFFVDEGNVLESESMYIANVQLMHIDGLPMYFFTGNPVEGTEVSNDNYDGYAFAFTVDDNTSEQVAEIIDGLTK